MGHYVSVRGWIEVDPEKLPRVKHLLQEFPNSHREGILTPEQVRFYAQGWLLAQVRVLAQTLYDADELHGDVVQRYEGMLCIDDDEGNLSLVWYLKDGAVLERTQHHAVP